MKFKYNPEKLDDFPKSVEVVAIEAEDDDLVEVGEVRWYEPAWKHKMAGKTIREQRERIGELEGLLKEFYECLAAHNEAREHPVGYTLGVMRDKLAKHGVRVGND